MKCHPEIDYKLQAYNHKEILPAAQCICSIPTKITENEESGSMRLGVSIEIQLEHVDWRMIGMTENQFPFKMNN